MRIEFTVDGRPCSFSRDWFTGLAALDIGGQTLKLQDPLNPLTHFSFRLTRTWDRSVDGHALRVQMRRPLLFAGFRQCSYSVFVDGVLVQTAKGR